MKKLIQISFLALIIVLAVQSCRKDDNGVINPASGNGMITGKVVDANGTPLSGVLVKSGGSTAITDGSGSYKLEKVAKGDNAIVKFQKESYSSTFRVTKVVDYKTSRADAALYSVGRRAIVSATTGGSVQTNGAEVIFPANGFKDLNGSAVTSDVTVELTYFNPLDEHFCEAFPGNFDGIRSNGSETAIESFGFINVDIFTSSGGRANLANGKTATIKIQLPQALVNKAPATIPLWSFDEARGRWIEDGSATLNGSVYIGIVTHFTSWNCDQPAQTSYLKGKVVDQDGKALSYAWVGTKGVDYTGSASTYSDFKGEDNNGEFRVAVKAESVAELWAIYSGFASAKQTYQTLPSGQTKDIGTIVVNVEPEDPKDGWYKIIPPVNDYIYDIKFLNDNVGFVLANDLYKTTDGGNSWTLSYDVPQNGKDSLSANAIQIISQNVIFLNGSQLAKSTDGGSSWKTISTDYRVIVSDFIDENVGYSWCDNTTKFALYKTTNGGDNWIEIFNTNEYPKYLNAFPDNKLILMTWNGMNISTDGGVTWVKTGDVPEKRNFGNIFVMSFNKIYFSGLEGLYLTTDAGITWNKLNDDIFMGVIFVDEINGWAVAGQNRILRTRDGGYTWVEQYKAEEQLFLDRIYMINQLRGFSSGYGGLFLRTDNGGEK